jgi:hypothetical protein
MGVDEKYAVVMDFHETWLAIQNTLSYSQKTPLECANNLNFAVYRAFSETNDTDAYYVLYHDVARCAQEADATQDVLKDIWIPRLTFGLMRKFRRVDVIKILHDFFYHEEVPTQETPPSTPRPSTPPTPPQPRPDRTCCICFGAEVAVICNPCGNICMCKRCAQILVRRGDNCPLCRVKIASIDDVSEDSINKVLAGDKSEFRGNVWVSNQMVSYFLGGKDGDTNLHELLRRLQGGA